MKRKLVADSSADILTYEGVDFAAAPLTILVGEQHFVDNAQLNIAEMLDAVYHHKGRTYSACPSLDAWMTSFADADEVFVVTISGGMSGSYNSAIAAREVYLQEHPEVKIHVFDSLNAGPGMRIVVAKIADLMKEGKGFDEIISEVEAYRSHARLFFSLESLHNLVQNGRVSKIAAVSAGVLGIRVLGTASTDGQFEQVAKCRGEKKLVIAYMESIRAAGYKGGRMFISHAQNEALALSIYNAVRAEFHNADVSLSALGGLCSYYAERHGVMLGCEC